MDLGSKAQSKRQGKTTFQVPISPQIVFYKNEGTKFSEMIDSALRAVLIIEVELAQAVTWTKPEDWEVDFTQPRMGLEGTYRSSLAAAFADGHVEIIDLSKTDDAKLRALLTRAGREVVEQW
jgi:hypothetical protein